MFLLSYVLKSTHICIGIFKIVNTFTPYILNQCSNTPSSIIITISFEESDVNLDNGSTGMTKMVTKFNMAPKFKSSVF